MADEKVTAKVANTVGDSIVVTEAEKRLMYAGMLMLQKSVKRANATEVNLQIVGLREQQIKEITNILQKLA